MVWLKIIKLRDFDDMSALFKTLRKGKVQVAIESYEKSNTSNVSFILFQMSLVVDDKITSLLMVSKYLSRYTYCVFGYLIFCDY